MKNQIMFFILVYFFLLSFTHFLKNIKKYILIQKFLKKNSSTTIRNFKSVEKEFKFINFELLL